MRLGLIGYGKMGKALHALAPLHGDEVTAIYTPSLHTLPLTPSNTQQVDVFLDFSTPEAVLPNLATLLPLGKPVVIGTTGWDASDLLQQKEIGILYASNFSLGVHLFSLILKEAAAKLLPSYKAALFEEHHEQKLDSPSGTAKMLLGHLPKNTPLSCLRVGSIVGNHEVLFDTPFDQIRLSHHAKSRDVFASGALKAASWLQGKKGTFTMEDFAHAF